MSVHPFKRPGRPPLVGAPAVEAPAVYTWHRYNDEAYTIARNGIVVGFVSIFPEIPFHAELVEKLPAIFAEHERVLRGDAS